MREVTQSPTTTLTGTSTSLGVDSSLELPDAPSEKHHYPLQYQHRFKQRNAEESPNSSFSLVESKSGLPVSVAVSVRAGNEHKVKSRPGPIRPNGTCVRHNVLTCPLCRPSRNNHHQNHLNPTNGPGDSSTHSNNSNGVSSNTSRKLVPAPPRQENQHRSLASIFSLQAQPGGLRQDCFNALPVEATGCVPGAVDHLVECLAPALFSTMPKLTNPVMAIAFPFALQHPDTFHALICFSQAHQDSLVRGYGKPSSDCLQHRVHAIRLLQAKLTDPDKQADDAAILASIYLLGSADRMKERAACEAFFAGIMRMVEIRGGLDNLGLGGYIKNCVLYIESLEVTSTNGAASTPRSPSSSPGTSDQDPMKLSYPRHPFSPKLCEIIARLPPGFEDLAISSALSEDLILTAERIFYWANIPGRNVIIEEGPAENIMDLRRIAKIIPKGMERRSEQVACTALLILSTELFTSINLSLITPARWDKLKRYCLEMEDDEGEGERSSREQEQEIAKVKIMADNQNLPTMTQLERELRAWALMISAKASHDDVNMTRIGSTLMDFLFDREPISRRWDKFLPVLRKFYCNEQLEQDWRKCWQEHVDRRGGKVGS